MKVEEYVQLVAWKNWSNLSLELTWWARHGSDPKQKLKQVHRAFMEVYSRLLENHAIEDIQGATFTTGMSDQILRTIPKDDLETTAVYFLYRGRCLDEENLSYFCPEEVLATGRVLLRPNGTITIEPLPSPRKRRISPEQQAVLNLRRVLGDDPKRIEMDEGRVIHGIQANVLLSLKKTVKVTVPVLKTWLRKQRHHNNLPRKHQSVKANKAV